jgi:predicted RNase H-like HicB family nuclease
MAIRRGLLTARALENIGAAASGGTREEAMKNINHVVHMIVQELVEDGKPLPAT